MTRQDMCKLCWD